MRTELIFISVYIAAAVIVGILSIVSDTPTATIEQIFRSTVLVVGIVVLPLAAFVAFIAILKWLFRD